MQVLKGFKPQETLKQDLEMCITQAIAPRIPVPEPYPERVDTPILLRCKTESILIGSN